MLIFYNIYTYILMYIIIISRCILKNAGTKYDEDDKILKK